MTSTLLSLFSLFLSGFLVMLAHGLSSILMPTRLNVEGFSTDNIGLIMSMYAVGMLLGGVFSRRLINQVGHIRVFAASAAIASISILICFLWINEWLWAFIRLFMGFSIASIFMVSDGWLSVRATNDTRARILAINQVVTLSAMFLGSFMINLSDLYSASLYILAGLLFCGGVVPIAISKVTVPPVEDSPSMPLLELYKLSPVGVMSVFACGIMLAMVFSMLVVFAEAKGITGFDASLLIGSSIMGGFIFQFPIGYLADKFDRRTVLFFMVLLSLVINLLLLSFFDHFHFYLILFFVAISSGIISSLYPLGLAEAFDRLVQSDMGSAIGAMVIIFAIGGILGPYASGVLMEQFGNDFFFVAFVFILAALGLFIFYRSKIRDSIPLEQQEQFVPQGASGIISNDLDPRTEYTEEVAPLSEVAQTIVTMAENRPELALQMVCLVAKSMPKKLEEVIIAVAAVEGVDGVEIYNILQEFAPDQQQELAPAIMAAAPEQSSEIVSAIFEDTENEDIAELATNLADAAPEQSFEIMEAATEAVIEENPEAVLEIAEAYVNNVAENLEDMRYADRLAEDNKAMTDMVNMMVEKAPDQVADVVVMAVEAIPEAASDMVEVLTETSDLECELVSDIDDKPETEEAPNDTDSSKANDQQ